MIVVCAKFRVLPEHVDGWLDRVAGFTRATRAEPGCLWFEWSRSVEEPDTFVLLEAFQDGAAEAHVGSDHFRRAQEELPPALAETPRIVNAQVDGDDWSRLGEMQVERPER